MMVEHVFSVYTADQFVEITEQEDTQHVTLALSEGNTISVDAEDLARALISASPAFAQEIGSFAQSVILQYLGREDD